MQLIKTIFLIGTYILLLSACTKQVEQRSELKKHYDKYQVDGTFLLYDLNKDQYIVYNSARADERFSPANTFQILNVLTALDSGAAKDENFVLHWDGTAYDYKPWNNDQDMKTAIRHSTVWYDRELARRVGESKMQDYISMAEYGNKDISSGIDTFWQEGSLKISAKEQIDFLEKFYKEELPFSKGSIQKLKSMLVLEDTARYKLRGKTGWGIHNESNIGWFVGYLEQNDNVYLIVNNIQANNPDLDNFTYARLGITKSILKELSLM
jgi:beta-lactamase class D